MKAIRFPNRDVDAVAAGVALKIRARTRCAASTSSCLLSATLDSTRVEPSRHRGAESTEAGPRAGDLIRERMTGTQFARAQPRISIHPDAETPASGRAVSVAPIPATLDRARGGSARVHGHRSGVCVGVDGLVYDRDRADSPKTKALRIG